MVTIVTAVSEPVLSEKEQTGQDGFFSAANLESIVHLNNGSNRF